MGFGAVEPDAPLGPSLVPAWVVLFDRFQSAAALAAVPLRVAGGAEEEEGQEEGGGFHCC